MAAETIRDRINAWGDQYVRNSGVMTRNTDCYNHMQEALQKLTSEPWASLVLGADMPKAGNVDDTPKVK